MFCFRFTLFFLYRPVSVIDVCSLLVSQGVSSSRIFMVYFNGASSWCIYMVSLHGVSADCLFSFYLYGVSSLCIYWLSFQRESS